MDYNKLRLKALEAVDAEIHERKGLVRACQKRITIIEKLLAKEQIRLPASGHRPLVLGNMTPDKKDEHKEPIAVAGRPLTSNNMAQVKEEDLAPDAKANIAKAVVILVWQFVCASRSPTG